MTDDPTQSFLARIIRNQEFFQFDKEELELFDKPGKMTSYARSNRGLHFMKLTICVATSRKSSVQERSIQY